MMKMATVSVLGSFRRLRLYWGLIMSKVQHRNDIVNSAIQGLVDGGLDETTARAFDLLLRVAYNSGYDEAIRNIEENLIGREPYRLGFEDGYSFCAREFS